MHTEMRPQCGMQQYDLCVHDRHEGIIAHLNILLFLTLLQSYSALTTTTTIIIYYFAIVLQVRWLLLSIPIRYRSLSDDRNPRALCVFLFAHKSYNNNNNNNNVYRSDSEVSFASQWSAGKARRRAKRKI